MTWAVFGFSMCAYCARGRRLVVERPPYFKFQLKEILNGVQLHHMVVGEDDCVPEVCFDGSSASQAQY